MFSSIEEEDRAKVIELCYWPLLQLAKQEVPIGIELSGVTLEIISNIDPTWVNELKKLIQERQIELIGSGYAQLIGPLVPARVNDWNLRIGNEIYQELLECRPNLAFVNEMAYSSGLVEHYKLNEYTGIIMEWNNPWKYHPEWNNMWRYYPQIAHGNDQKDLPVIWADSIAFQKFQRYVHGEIELDEYVTYLKSHASDVDAYFPLYSNDVEIFDFRPGRFKTEESLGTHSEWDRIFKLFEVLSKEQWCCFVFPSDVLAGLTHRLGGNLLSLETTEHPIPVKKQEKYNINRWALTGRSDLEINTSCFQIYRGLLDKEVSQKDDWKELCYLWSSDFRTHITEQRWTAYKDHLKQINDRYSIKEVSTFNEWNSGIEYPKYLNYLKETDRWLFFENDCLKLVMDKRKGMAIRECVFKNVSEKSLFGTLEHGFFDDIALGVDFYTGHSIIDKPGQHRIADLAAVIPSVNSEEDGLIINWSINQSNISFNNSIFIKEDSIQFKKTIHFEKRELMIVHPFHVTLNPHAWDKNSLYYGTHNGGWKYELFKLNKNGIHHNDILSSLISAKHGLGATEGIIIIGDKDKSVRVIHNQSMSALIPSIIFKKINDEKFFLRLQYSAQEMDDTTRIAGENVVPLRCSFLIC